nr:unnamed protein product [Digitaria exilis]
MAAMRGSDAMHITVVFSSGEPWRPWHQSVTVRLVTLAVCALPSRVLAYRVHQLQATAAVEHQRSPSTGHTHIRTRRRIGGPWSFGVEVPWSSGHRILALSRRILGRAQVDRDGEKRKERSRRYGNNGAQRDAG